jgi:hypothetical protein
MDTHMNVRTPMKGNQKDKVLTADEFEKDLYEFFVQMKDNDVIWTSSIWNKEPYKTNGKDYYRPVWFAKVNSDNDANFIDHFHNFAIVEYDFEFTVPSTKIGNALFDANGNEWQVKGYSGRTYTIYVSKDNMKIQVKVGTVQNEATDPVVAQIYKKGNKTMLRYGEYGTADASTDVENDIYVNTPRYKSAETYDMVWDILNIDAHYNLLNGPSLGERQTFTAYIKIITPSTCIPLVLNNGYFNTKFLRPLNWEVKGAKINTDAINGRQVFPMADLATFSDWRDVKGNMNASPVTPNGTTGTLGATWMYYGVTVEIDDETWYTDNAEFNREKLNTREEIETAIKNGDLRKTSTLTGLDFTITKSGSITGFYTADGKSFSEKTYNCNANEPWTWVFSYKNNEGTVNKFHIYVPVIIKYTYSPQGTWYYDASGNKVDNKVKGDDDLVLKSWISFDINDTANNAKKN